MNQLTNASINQAKVGLLLCDHIAPQYQHIALSYAEMFAAIYPNFDFEVFEVCDGIFPESVNACEVYVCTGSHFSVYDEVDWVLQLKDFVREIFLHQKKYIGHCFGHQLLAEALGGKVQKAAVGWCVGVHTFEVKKREAWMLPFQESFNVLMLCQDQVEELPPNSVGLAGGKDAPIGM
ncbi:MAG: type 1 glutamine amidotransferase, partial [Chitinophagales bacterium]